MAQIKVSIIIPVYNVEKFLPDCLISCINQEGMVVGKDYEIIVINDGSTDKSHEVLKRFQSAGVIILDQVNKGVSNARNSGLNHSSGKYVWFIDSDDYIAHDALRIIWEELKMNNYPEAIKILKYAIKENENYCKDIITQYRYKNIDKPSTTTAVNLITKRELLITNHITFNEKMKYGEDTLWVFFVNLFSKETAIYNKSNLYFYRIREGSAMRSKSSCSSLKHLEDMFLMMKSYRETLNLPFLNRYQKKNIKTRVNWCVQNIMIDAVRQDKILMQNTITKLQHDGLYPFKINWNRLTFNYGIKNCIITLIGFTLRYKYICGVINYIYLTRLKSKRVKMTSPLE